MQKKKDLTLKHRYYFLDPPSESWPHSNGQNEAGRMSAGYKADVKNISNKEFECLDFRPFFEAAQNPTSTDAEKTIRKRGLCEDK